MSYKKTIVIISLLLISISSFGYDFRSFSKKRATSVFYPSFIPDLIGWYDPSDYSTITLNGSDISQIDDKSGNSNHLSQATASEQPAYNAATFNNLGSIYYVNSDDLRLDSPAINTGAKEFTIFRIIRLVAYSLLADTSFDNIGAATNLFLTISHSTSFKAQQAVWEGYLVDEIFSDAAFSTGNDYMATTYYSDNNSSVYLNVNGVKQSDTTTANAVSVSFDGVYTLGNHPSVKRTPTAYFGEVLIYDRGLTPAEISKVEMYLSHKWGITI